MAIVSQSVVSFIMQKGKEMRSDYSLVGKVHKNSLDNMSPSQIRVVLEHLLSSMEINQRNDLRNTFPGLYKMIYPEWENNNV